MTHTFNSNFENKILNRLRGLPPQKLDEIIQFIDFVVERNQQNLSYIEEGKAKSSIMALRG